MNKHVRTYSAALVLLGVLALVSSGLLLYLAGVSAAGEVNTILPDWALVCVAIVNFAYASAIFVTFYARRFWPETGRQWTRLLNWALLPTVPGGTVVGLYGLLVSKMERAMDPTAKN